MISYDPTGVETSAVRTLLDRTPDDDAAFEAMLRDGWGELYCAPERNWLHVREAVAALGTIARERRDVPLLAHLLARSALVDANAGVDTDDAGELRYSIASDALGRDGHVEVNLWTVPGAVSAVVGPIDGSLYLVDLEPARIRAAPPLPLDATARRRRVSVERAELSLLCDDPAVAGRHTARSALLLAIDTLHAIDSARDDTLAYTKNRLQFGAPLAHLQVVQHRLVDMYGVCVLGSALVARITGVIDSPEADDLSWHLKSFVDRHAVDVVEQCIQLHGATGFSWETGLHWVLRRAQINRRLFGGPG